MGQDRRARRRGRRPRPRARARAGCDRRRGRGLPAALSVRARPRGDRRIARRPRPGPPGARRDHRADDRRRGRERLSAAARGPSAGVRSRRHVRATRRRRLRRQRLALWPVLPRRARDPPDRARESGRHPPSPRLAYRPGGDPARCLAGRRPGPRPGRDRHDPPQPGVPRLDRTRPARTARARAGRWRAPGGRRRGRPDPRGHRPGRGRQHRLAGVRPGGAHARGRVRAVGRARGQGRSLRRDPQRARHGSLGSGHRFRHRGALLGRGSDGQDRLSGGSARADRVRSGRRLGACSG